MVFAFALDNRDSFVTFLVFPEDILAPALSDLIMRMNVEGLLTGLNAIGWSGQSG